MVLFYLRCCFQKSTNLLDKTEAPKNAFKKIKDLLHFLIQIKSSVVYQKTFGVNCGGLTGGG